MTIYYEPWQPEVGQRVKVRLSGECQHVGRIRHAEKVWYGTHPNFVDGLCGSIIEVRPDGYKEGHRFRIQIDTADLVGLEHGRGFFAALELEPVP